MYGRKVFEVTQKKGTSEAPAGHLVGMAHRFARMLNERDVDMLDELSDKDYVNHNPYVEDGREANKRFWSDWIEAFPDTEVVVEDAFADEAGEKVVGRFTYRAIHEGEFHEGEFMGARATGRPVEVRSIDIWRVRDGVFVEHWDELNTLEVFDRLGLVSAAVGGEQEGENCV